MLHKLATINGKDSGCSLNQAMTELNEKSGRRGLKSVCVSLS